MALTLKEIERMSPYLGSFLSESLKSLGYEKKEYEVKIEPFIFVGKNDDENFFGTPEKHIWYFGTLSRRNTLFVEFGPERIEVEIGSTDEVFHTLQADEITEIRFIGYKIIMPKGDYWA